jgi:hypothetical protein
MRVMFYYICIVNSIYNFLTHFSFIITIIYQVVMYIHQLLIAIL